MAVHAWLMQLRYLRVRYGVPLAVAVVGETLCAAIARQSCSMIPRRRLPNPDKQ